MQAPGSNPTNVISLVGHLDNHQVAAALGYSCKPHAARQENLPAPSHSHPGPAKSGFNEKYYIKPLSRNVQQGAG